MRGRISIYSIVVLLSISAPLLAQIAGENLETVSDGAGPVEPPITVLIKNFGMGSPPPTTTETIGRFSGSFTKHSAADFVLRQASNCTGVFDGHTSCPLRVEIGASEDDDQGLRTASLDVLTRQPDSIAHTRFTGLFTTQGRLTLGSRGPIFSRLPGTLRPFQASLGMPMCFPNSSRELHPRRCGTPGSRPWCTTPPPTSKLSRADAPRGSSWGLEARPRRWHIPSMTTSPNIWLARKGQKMSSQPGSTSDRFRFRPGLPPVSSSSGAM
jgi:hypothetical protein